MLISINMGIKNTSRNTSRKTYRNTSFSVGNEIVKSVIIFGVNMSSSTKIDNGKKDILILGIGPTQRLEHTLSAEKMYSINFTKKKYKILFEFAL